VLVIGVAAAAAKLGFDSLVQRDAPVSDTGRLLAQFEARFQMLWVFGAFVPVVVPLPDRVGFLLIGLLAGAASASYLLGRQPLGATLTQLARRGTQAAGAFVGEDGAAGAANADRPDRPDRPDRVGRPDWSHHAGEPARSDPLPAPAWPDRPSMIPPADAPPRPARPPGAPPRPGSQELDEGWRMA
jgi:hypothetical protein